MYLISYHIKPRGRSFQSIVSSREDIEDEIVKFGSWWRYFGDVWIVDTELTVDQMTVVLLEHLHTKDDLLIIGIQAPYQGWLPDDAWEWLDKVTQKQKATAAR
jgi:hypothetical protein